VTVPTTVVLVNWCPTLVYLYVVLSLYICQCRNNWYRTDLSSFSASYGLCSTNYILGTNTRL